MSINCVVIDDELPAIKQMEVYIERIPFLKLLKSFDNAIEPIAFLQNNQVDLLFLDIEMEGFTGLQLIKTLRHQPKIILTTAYDQYALDAFNLNVSDYLLKPISFERFVMAIDRIYDSFQYKKQIESTEGQYKRDYFFVKTDYKMQRIDFKDILFVEGMKEYLRIHTTNGNIMVLQSFKNLEESLPQNQFIRVHKSYLVAISKIESVERNRIKIGEELIPVSETYKDALMMVLSK